MIVIDKETGINYLALITGGITPLLNTDGTPIISLSYNANSYIILKIQLIKESR